MLIAAGSDTGLIVFVLVGPAVVVLVLLVLRLPRDSAERLVALVCGGIGAILGFESTLALMDAAYDQASLHWVQNWAYS